MLQRESVVKENEPAISRHRLLADPLLDVVAG